MYEKAIKRYAAYFFGWCQAFGEHDVTFEENKDVNWLFGELKVGIIVSPKIRRLFLKTISKQKQPTVILSTSHIEVDNSQYPILEEDRHNLERALAFLKKYDGIHMFLANHFCYPPPTKIITFSAKKPLLILYKEITPIIVKVIKN
jgi:hypothetical protein